MTGDGTPIDADRPGGATPPPLSPTIHVQVRPAYLAAESEPALGHWVWAYHVRIENRGEAGARLFWRHWHIHDPVAGEQEVQGEGVVGETPWLEPGGSHEYQSFCVLRSPAGHMDGFYHFRRADGSTFRARIPRFELQAPLGGPEAFVT
ncbi:MAG: Co2+/Mg2+ efflux protein ApaG [Gemmatimonadota bacterium]